MEYNIITINYVWKNVNNYTNQRFGYAEEDKVPLFIILLTWNLRETPLYDNYIQLY